MELYTKTNMKDLLAQGLFLVMQEKAFDKITIKMICDKTGVIRGTFYNHFIDKYECLEYLVNKMLFSENDSDNVSDDIRYYLEVIDTNRSFFRRCFSIEGQNSFESILENAFIKHYDYLYNDHKIKKLNISSAKDFITLYYSRNISFIIKYWVTTNSNISIDQMIELTNMLLTNSPNEFFDIR